MTVCNHTKINLIFKMTCLAIILVNNYFSRICDFFILLTLPKLVEFFEFYYHFLLGSRKIEVDSTLPIHTNTDGVDLNVAVSQIQNFDPNSNSKNSKKMKVSYSLSVSLSQFEKYSVRVSNLTIRIMIAMMRISL